MFKPDFHHFSIQIFRISIENVHKFIHQDPDKKLMYFSVFIHTVQNNYHKPMTSRFFVFSEICYIFGQKLFI